MRAHLSLSLFGVLVIGCGHNPSPDVSLPPQGDPEAVVKELRAGQSEWEVRAAMKSVALDSGTVYWGGSGAKRLYFALPQNRQLWVECAGDGRVIEVGRIEPKQHWVRHSDDSITVE